MTIWLTIIVIKTDISVTIYLQLSKLGVFYYLCLVWYFLDNFVQFLFIYIQSIHLLQRYM